MPLTFITAHLIVDLVWNHFIINRYHKQPDLSFFRAFRCATVVHRGRDLVEHTKLAPRGVLGVYLSVGISHGRRAFIVNNPWTSQENVTIDETY